MGSLVTIEVAAVTKISHPSRLCPAGYQFGHAFNQSAM